jgi:hypothetical protein
MMPGWQIVAFPVILPWREEFWTLPLYFPDLKVGEARGWPGSLPYRGLPLPPEAVAPAGETKGLRPGELRQWQAFKEYRQAQEEGEDDLIQAIRRYGEASQPVESGALLAWRLAWQLEKMQADQESRLIRVDQGQDWLAEILAPEPWEERPFSGSAPGIGEIVDPELARMRYFLWQRTMAPYLEGKWTPLLLGRTARPIFLTLKGWPEWPGPRTAMLSLPGCRSEAEWLKVRDDSGLAERLPEFGGMLARALTRVGESPDLAAAVGEIQEFAARVLTPGWPLDSPWTWDLEIWGPEPDETEGRPVLCWTGAGSRVLPA